MKKNVILTLLLFFVYASTLFAGSFHGVIPGATTKEEAFNLLGDPRDEVIKGERYVFDPERFDLKVLSVVFYADVPVVKKIELYPEETLYYDDYKEWFNLNEPFARSTDPEGKLVETFLPHNVRLHYDGPSADAAVIFMEHFDPAEYEDFSMLPASRPYLGIRLVGHPGAGYKIATVEEGSPAAVSGLQSGDVIVKINDLSYEDKEIDPTSFMSVLSILPLGEESTFVIHRSDTETGEVKRLSFNVPVHPMSKVQMENNAKQALVLFQKGQFLLNNGDVYAALDVFKNAIWLNPYEPLFYASLADAYYRIGLTEFAIEEVQKSIGLNSQHFSFFLLRTIYIDQQKYAMAVHSLTKALALNSSDVQIREKLGYCYMKQEKYEKALSAFKTVLRQKEHSPSALFFSGRCSEKLNRLQDALIFYKKYLATDPSQKGMREEAQNKISELRG